METPSHEVEPRGVTPEHAYEQNYALLLELKGRINGRLATKRRADVPRGWEHIGEQDEIMAMLLSVADYLGHERSVLLDALSMSHDFMQGIDELQQMSDLSGPALYRAEVKRIPLLPREEQPAVIEAARNDDEAAQHELLLTCLNWTMRRAAALCGTYPPQHSDIMDLVGHAGLKMMEALPIALRADDPVAYCMTVGAKAIRWYCLYNDPLVQRKRDEPLTYSHPATISLEENDEPVPECPEHTCTDFTLVYEALGTLSKRHQAVLIAAYGLHGEARHRNEDFAALLGVDKGTVEK